MQSRMRLIQICYKYAYYHRNRSPYPMGSWILRIPHLGRIYPYPFSYRCRYFPYTSDPRREPF
jgi:hypothetical protein